MKQGESDSELYGTPDSLISVQSPKIYVSNFSNMPITIRAGEILGEGCDPRTYLDSETSITKEELQLREIYIASIRRIVETQATRSTSTTLSTVDKIFDPSRKLHPEADQFNEPPLEGGPKTAKTPPEAVAEEDLLKEIDISKELSDTQKQSFERMLLRNREAFGINGELGNYPGKVEIPVAEGTKPVCIPPFGGSPASREVI
ncbi:hypothetical protein M413DRAFT_75964, partial [Hebeloma cylindrosporum]